MSTVVWRWCKVWVVATLLSISACSETSFVYNRLNLLLPWYVDDYAELNQAQKAYLDELLVPFLTWHRTQELPNYVKILASIENSLSQPLTPAAVSAIFTEFQTAWFRLEDASLNWLVDLGDRLSEEQISNFLGSLTKQKHEYEEKYLKRSDKEFYEDSYDNMVDSAQDYLGSLSDKQRELLRASSLQLQRSDHAWIQERSDWFKQLAVLLERKPGWQQRLREAVVARRENIAPEYLRIYQHNMGVIYDTIAQLLNGRSDEQDRHLRRKLSDLRDDIEMLIAQGRHPAESPSG